MEILSDSFGSTKEGKEIKKFTLRNSNNVVCEIINLGCTITSIKIPDRNGKVEDIVLGFSNIEGYQSESNPYFGCVIGRVCNRIAKGKFTLNGKEYNVTVNNGPNSLHGGTVGWDKAVWDAEVKDDLLILHHTSSDGDQGYPGEVQVSVSFRLTENNELIINFKANTTKSTPINLTTHSYFNLGGSDSKNIYEHEVLLPSQYYLPVDTTLIPTGSLEDVNGTVFDLRQSKRLGDVIDKVDGGGYDHNFCVRGPTGRKLAAKVSHPGTGRVLEVYTNQPGVQFYTGFWINVPNGKGDTAYTKHAGLALEPQNYPNAVNERSFPDSVLTPESVYQHQMSYKFMTD